MRSTGRLVLTVLLFGMLLAPLAFAVLTDAGVRRAVHLLRPVLEAEKSIPIQGERRVISHREDAVLESFYRVYFDPPGRRRVVFDRFLRNGEPVEADNWWKGFFRGKRKGRTSRARQPEFFQRLAAMAGWDLPRLGRLFFSSSPRRFHDLGLLARNYSIYVERRDIVAGREVEVIRIEPCHEGRTAYALWADVETRFPLVFQVRDAKSGIAFESRFDTIAYEPEFPEGIFRKKGRRNPEEFFRKLLGIEMEPVSLRQAAGMLEFPVWEPGLLPPGVREEDSSVVSLRLPTSWLGGDKKGEVPIQVVHATYTDGAASVFLIEFSTDNPFWQWVKPMLQEEHPAQPQEGKLLVYRLSHKGGTAFLMERDRTTLVVSGNLPEPELLNMVKGLRRIP